MSLLLPRLIFLILKHQFMAILTNMFFILEIAKMEGAMSFGFMHAMKLRRMPKFGGQPVSSCDAKIHISVVAGVSQIHPISVQLRPPFRPKPKFPGAASSKMKLVVPTGQHFDPNKPVCVAEETLRSHLVSKGTPPLEAERPTLEPGCTIAAKPPREKKSESLHGP